MNAVFCGKRVLNETFYDAMKHDNVQKENGIGEIFFIINYIPNYTANSFVAAVQLNKPFKKLSGAHLSSFGIILYSQYYIFYCQIRTHDLSN